MRTVSNDKDRVAIEKAWKFEAWLQNEWLQNDPEKNSNYPSLACMACESTPSGEMSEWCCNHNEEI
jgi:hypothetical protein